MLQITIFDTKIEYFFAVKISLFETQSPYLKTQISLFESKKISHVWRWTAFQSLAHYRFGLWYFSLTILNPENWTIIICNQWRSTFSYLLRSIPTQKLKWRLIFIHCLAFCTEDFTAIKLPSRYPLWSMCNWCLFNWFHFILWYLLDFATNMY